MHRRFAQFTFAGAVILGLAGCANQSSPEDSNAPANVILIIGDGMDQAQLTIARNYLQGGNRGLLLDTLPALASVRVQTLDAQQPGQFNYVADSANTATTLATGQLTSTGRISRDVSGLQDLPTIVQQAQAAGYRTGIVTTSSVTDATPAAFASHIRHRRCEGPESLVKPMRWFMFDIDCTDEAIDKGGPGSIAHQLASSGVDVLLGGGARFFDQAGYGGEGQAGATAVDNGYQRLDTGQDLEAASLEQPTLGLFAPDHLPVQLMGEGGRKAEPVMTGTDQPNLAGEVFHCVQNPAADSIPTLQAMTDKALAGLASDGERGFLLVIESASIDKQSHARNPCGHIGEVQQLEEALKSALDYATENPNTLILVTADHAHAAQIIPDQEQFSFGEQSFHSPGSIARVRTPEGTIMMVNYATSNLPIEMHTGNNVPLYASGPGAEDLQSYVNQRDIYTMMVQFLDLYPGFGSRQWSVNLPISKFRCLRKTARPPPIPMPCSTSCGSATSNCLKAGCNAIPEP